MKSKTVSWYVFVPLALLGAAATLALPQKASAPSPQPAAPGPSVSSVPAALTELEQAKLENLQLKFSLLQQQQTQLQSQYQVLVAQIQKEHPGFVWDAQKNQLVSIPLVQAAPPTKTK